LPDAYIGDKAMPGNAGRKSPACRWKIPAGPLAQRTVM